MARPAGANVHVGKAAALIVVALALGFIVLNDNSSGSLRAAASTHVSIPDSSSFTSTTLGSKVTTTTAATERQPAQIKVIAINATGRKGVASQASARLRDAGYNAQQPGNAIAAVTNSHPVSAIYVVTPGFNREALTIAALFHLPDSAVKPLPSPSPSADIRSDTNIAVLVGSGITL